MIGSIINLFVKKRRVSTLLFRDDRTIRHDVLPVEDRYIVDEKNARAWGLRSNMLLPFRNKNCEVIIEHDCSPMSLNGEKWDAEFKPIAAEAYNKQFMKIQKEGVQAKAWSFFTTIGLILGICFVIVILAGLLKSGTLRLPFGG